MKRPISIVLALALVVVLAACGASHGRPRLGAERRAGAAGRHRRP